MKNKKRPFAIKGHVSVDAPFTLYLHNEPQNFNNMMEFTVKTGISSIVAQDLLNGKTHYPFKGWFTS